MPPPHLSGSAGCLACTCPLQDYPLQPLVDDCRLLGSLLDDCLRIEVGEELFQKVPHGQLTPLLAAVGILACCSKT